KGVMADTRGGTAAKVANAAFKPVLLNQKGAPVVPNGSIGHRFSEEDTGRWNLDLGDVDPLLSIVDAPDYDGATAEVDLPRFDIAPDPDQQHAGGAGSIRRGVPVRTVAGRTVTTVFDLLLAQYGVGREGMPGEWPTGYDD